MLKTIIFAFDDDKMGQKFRNKKSFRIQRFINKYSMKLVKYKGYKDFNEYLQAIYNQNFIQNVKFKEKKVAEITR